MPAFKDLTGRRFGKLVVVSIEPVRTASGKIRWKCLCDCGSYHIANMGNLTVGNTNSCGCAHYAQGRLTRKSPHWRRWASMMSRCYKPKDRTFKNYGGRGIAVCESWHHFPNFLSDIGPTFFKGASLDRIDNDKGYSPDNCRWATNQQQTVNRRCSIMIDTPWGKMNVAEAAKKLGVPRGRFSTRVRLGWTIEQLFDPENAKAMTKWDRRKGARAT